VTALVVNGVERRVDAAPDTPLLYVLRNDLGLVGCRFGCGMGQCGACNVLVDGEVVASCDTPLAAVAGRAVTTVEAFEHHPQLAPLVQAFLEEQAAQCAYCAPGILISAAALLSRHATPSRDDVCAALDGNLCRCGAHDRMIRAVLRAAELVT
jgi:nicotinate dehydrogenase subunit A